MRNKVDGIRVSQWLENWNNVEWDEASYRREPRHEFFLFSIKASDLKKLSGIYRRHAQGGEKRTYDTGIQRSHDAKRSKRIKEFVKHGYPYCELTEYQKEYEQHASLRKPGWLPTGIVINILTQDDKRKGKVVDESDMIELCDNGESKIVSLNLPEGFDDERWRPETLPPVEVIDGQHRLWAFNEDFAPDYEMPVIAFYGLDISWQAYLFWSINITPVRINRSLAFDMYPLLRAEDWVDKAGHKVYQEARAQEIVETLWSHRKSPWKNKINMLAEPGNPYIRQATWIRAFLNSFVKNSSGSSRIGGLFGAASRDGESILPWARSQQAAFVIFFGNLLLNSVHTSCETWVEELRKNKTQDSEDSFFEPGMFDKKSLLNSDQGIRSVLLLLNEICVVNVKEYDFYEWEPVQETGGFSEDSIDDELERIEGFRFSSLLRDISETLASYDWRTSAAPGLSEDAAQAKKVFRGSGGYVELRKDVLRFCIDHSVSDDLSQALESVAEVTGLYE